MVSAAAGKPVVLSINGHDPSGATGITADVETLFSLGCYCTGATSVINVRDTAAVKDRQPVSTPLLIEQIRAVLEDFRVDLIKVGDLGSVGNVEAVHTILTDYQDIPVVLAPTVVTPEDDAATNAIRLLLCPHAHLLIISDAAAQRLAPGGDSSAARAQALLDYDCDHLLLTGIPLRGGASQNQLYDHRGLMKDYAANGAAAEFHGLGTTLAAAVSAYLAHGFTLLDAVQQGQNFTDSAVAEGLRLGMGRLIPNRLHWAK